MRELVSRIEYADAFISASPTNVYATTALFKRFTDVFVGLPGARPDPLLAPSAARRIDRATRLLI